VAMKQPKRRHPRERVVQPQNPPQPDQPPEQPPAILPLAPGELPAFFRQEKRESKREEINRIRR
jgi:hypothetical protein